MAKIKPKKSLGQHFLRSEKALSDIMSAAGVGAGDTVLEIGPGEGVLTEKLVASGARVIAVEKDERACALLREKFSEKLKLECGDILETDLSELGLSEKEFFIVANIPYYITGAILELFLEHGPRPKKIVMLVQKEVADRIVSKPGQDGRKKESVLSISVKAFGDPKIVSRVPRGAFTPPPDVDSAVICIENIGAHRFGGENGEFGAEKDGLGNRIAEFFKIVKAGFAHKRKILIRNLEDARVFNKNELENVWEKLGLSKNVRAEELGVDDWLSMLATLPPKSLPPKS